MEKTIEDLKVKVADKRRGLWLREPEELKILKKTNFPKSNSFASVMYAYAEIYHLTKNISLYQEMLANGEVAFEEGRKLLSRYLTAAAARYETWKLVDSAALVTEVARTVRQAEDFDEVRELLDELLIYNNKLFVWLDTSIPWFQLGRQITFT